MFAELVGVALAVPAYCFVHLLTSTTVSASKTSVQQSGIRISENNLTLLPWSTALGHAIPLGMALRTSSTVTTPVWQSQEYWIAARLFHPVFTVVIHTILSQIVPGSGFSKTP